MTAKRRSARVKSELSEPERIAREQKRLRGARKLRISILTLLLVGGGLRVLERAYEVQVAQPASLGDYEPRHPEEIEIQARRGTIYDRRGAELAVSIDFDTFFVDPVALKANKKDLGQTARDLGRVLNIDADALRERMNKMVPGKNGLTPTRFVLVKRHVTPAESRAVAQLNLAGKGLGVSKEPRRFYPNVGLAAHVLGFTDDKGNGLEGLERAFDSRLRGATDKVSAVFDAKGGVVFAEELQDASSAQGRNLRLTLDREIQVIAERELELRVRAVEAKSGHVVVMDPHTGGILALANYPTFNPNMPGRADPSARRNRAVTDRFEPGSVVKTFTVAGALAAGAIGPTQQIDCENGKMRVGTSIIHDTHPYSMLTPAEILAHSSNIGVAKVGGALGRPGLYQALKRFGFGARTDVDLPTETEGVLRPYKRWYDIDAATVAFGHGMSVTNLQLAAAMAAIANGGKLMKPQIVESVTDIDGKVVETVAPSVRRQVVPAEIARTVGSMLTAVTGPGGTGEAAALEGYLVAGKTGTAQKASHRSGYADGQFTSSFVGFVPAQRPRLVISVVIDEPLIEHYGGTVAGPVFRGIASEALRHLGVPPETSGDKLADVLKQIREQQAAEGRTPPSSPGASKRPPGPAEARPDGKVRVPDLKGYGARAAMVALSTAELTVTLTGSGIVGEQSPPAGTLVDRGANVQVGLKRPGAPRPGRTDRKPRDEIARAEPLASAIVRVTR